MDKDEIRAIALEVAKEMNAENLTLLAQSEFLEFATRFLAAIAEKAEPVASVNTEALAFLKRNDDWIRARLPSNEATDTNLFTHLAIEPAPCTEDDKWNCKYCGKIKTCEAIKDSRNFGKPVGAPPLPDEVARMVATLSEMCWDECDSAAKMIERLAANQVPDKYVAVRLDQLERLAQQVPDGCVVVPRELLDGLCKYGHLHTVEGVAYSQGSHRELLGRASDLIAAGEVKP